jgi:hypothetical chaperone protein
MFVGFDFGTSNCAIGVMQGEDVKLLELDRGKAFKPSLLYAYDRDLISEYVALAQTDGDKKSAFLKSEFLKSREGSLIRARQARMQEGYEQDEQLVFVGREAFDEYLSLPEEGYYIKSPKSFLGASGLRTEYIQFFEDVVAAMMLNVKRIADAQLKQPITHAVIGRPVNFQGLNAEQSNAQALAILEIAAKRAGFLSVDFLYEPVAAGLEYEVSLEENKRVLVVDIGGGTSDFAMLNMGPDFRDKADRGEDFVAHTGERVGGNDFDIQFAAKELMPLLGMGSLLRSGLAVPTQPYWDAVSINDVNALTRFASKDMALELDVLCRDAASPELIKRLQYVQEHRLNHRVVRVAEAAKISLSSSENTVADLGFVESSLDKNVLRTGFESAVEPPLSKMMELMQDCIQQAGEMPDVVFLTGGSAQSQILRKAIHSLLGDVELVSGDHLGSVAAGLTRWAQRCF